MAQLGIESVLVAGRGPAACAVIAACTRLGVKAVAVHSEAERSARHVRLADDAVLLGPAPAAESYLAVDRIVEAARRSGVRRRPARAAGAGRQRPPGGRRRRGRAAPGSARTPRCSSGSAATAWSRPASAASWPG